ncbi:hypothetical protein EJC49_02515 [Aquibium carbonis]|uniref:Uncharacterized protein n=1 Tax=Aquibium carbonis TaxID=2495581 RepID=A0A429Z330_9HYPH|nr:hypothetical protein [Aquibium carbonis]RST88030.1 hypothetical protein EJC49_02515 [Aquibium carbonis]
MIDPVLGSTLPNRSIAEVAGDEIRPVVDAVCAELGIAARECKRRATIEKRILIAWRRGPRQPLDLVRAGLEG